MAARVEEMGRGREKKERRKYLVRLVTRLRVQNEIVSLSELRATPRGEVFETLFHPPRERRKREKCKYGNLFPSPSLLEEFCGLIRGVRIFFLIFLNLFSFYFSQWDVLKGNFES